MNFSHCNDELDIFEDDEDDIGMLNYYNTMAGNTITIYGRFELKQQEGFPNICLIVKKDGIN